MNRSRETWAEKVVGAVAGPLALGLALTVLMALELQDRMGETFDWVRSKLDPGRKR